MAGADVSNLASPPCVVVGVDGSRSALDTALWAVDEAVSRDIPLRLVYAIDPAEATGSDNQAAAHDLATAEIAIRHAFTLVEATDKPVKIEVEILQGRPVPTLKHASRSAAMLCVGSSGLKSCTRGRIGSTASAVATGAHCPVAIVQPSTKANRFGQIVAEVSQSPSSDAVLRRALEEARLRQAPVSVVTTWQPRYTDIHDSHAVAAGNRLARSRLDRRLAGWRKRHPDLEIEAVAVHGSFLNYLAANAQSIQLIVVAHDRAHGLGELVGPGGYGALRNGNCSVLICDPQNVL